MANSDLPDDLRSLCVVVKKTTNFTMEFEAEIPKKFGLAYYALAVGNKFVRKLES